jgi:hypothetical protein
MFGYIKPHQPELLGREAALYRSAYCGLCHTLSARYGPKARLLVNYDFVLSALLFWEGTCKQSKRRCIKSPFKKHCCLCRSPSLDYAADALMLFTSWKLKDTASDSRFPLPARIVSAFYRKHFRLAAERLTKENAVCGERMAEIRRLEGENDNKLEVASSFGEMLASLSMFYGDDRRAAHSLFYHLGRWITIIDAADDLSRDVKLGRYNAVSAAGLTPEDAFALMGSEQELALAAFDLLPENEFSGITRNILSFGLHARGHEIYKKKGGAR